MKFGDVLNRITGFSVPVFGVQWSPTETERSVARRILAFLEDRRVLYVPSEMEQPHQCVESVLRIREFLTAELGSLDSKTSIAQSLRALRAACRKFHDTVNVEKGAIIRHGAEYGHYASWLFNGALGELRGVFGVHIATLAASYGLDVEGELASILPATGDDC